MTGSAPKRQKSERGRKLSEKPTSSSRSSDSPLRMPPQVSDTTESRALVYFLTQYVQVAPEEEKCKSYVDHLVPLYLDPNMSLRLFHATSAVSMLTLAKKTDKSSDMEGSRVNYGKAVGLLREAVADPQELRTDDTLMTALILGLYDSIAANRDAPFAWRHHVDGAFAMVNLRRYDTLTSQLSQKLYWAVKSHAAISHVMRCEPIEPYTDWKTIWRTPLGPARLESYAYMITVTALRLPALRHAATKILTKPMRPCVALEVLRLLANVKVLDAELACWPYTVPVPWRPSLVGWKHGELSDIHFSGCYPGPVWNYYNWWIANVWNMYRALRCYCQGLIISCVERLVPEDEVEEVSEYVCAVRTQQRMVDDICASIPICLGDSQDFNLIDPVGSPRPASGSKDDTETPKGPPAGNSLMWPKNPMSGYFLIWNLETASSIPTIPRRQRAWLLGRMEEVGRRFGLGIATVTADELRRIIQSDATATATHFEPLPYRPYPDLEELVQGERDMRLDIDLVGNEVKVEKCITDLARRYSELQDL